LLIQFGWEIRVGLTIAVTRERREGETRCAVTPETVRKLLGLGATVTVEAGTGLASSIPDTEYTDAGASVKPDTRAVLEGADLVLKVRGPTAQEIAPTFGKDRRPMRVSDPDVGHHSTEARRESPSRVVFSSCTSATRM